jgi:signal transduction histidine kinase/DNA-binding response OmpR family regulator/HPt (histidine-containing phosphotransfer) domain-containing protein
MTGRVTGARAGQTRLTIGRILAVGFALALVALTVIGVSAYFRIGTLLQERVPVDHTYDVLHRIEGVRERFIDAERSQRGYLITGQESYLGPYQDALDHVGGDVAGLRHATADNPRQQAELDTMAAPIQTKLTVMADGVALRRSSGFAAAQRLSLTGRGTAAMTQIEGDLDQMRREEVRLLGERQAASKQSALRTRALILWGSAVAALIVGGGAWWVTRRITRPIREVTAAANRIIAGDLSRPAVVSGLVELEQMAAAVNASIEAISQARDQAVAAAAAKSTFLSTMSHEIRTPMNAVIGMTGLLMDSELSDDQQEFVQTVRVSGEALLGIINDILDFSKIESGELELDNEPFDVRECMDSALALVALDADGKHLELVGSLDAETPTVLRGDVTRIRQVMVNLLSNAVKFTASGEVVITVCGRSLEPGTAGPVELTVSVRDTGPGIPADRTDRVFRSFAQGDSSTTRMYGGTGLGLAISRRLARAMGGDITLTSEVGVGSTFTLTARLTGCPDLALGPPDRAALRGTHALIVDDNATNCRVLGLQLTGWGLHCTAVGSAAEALELVGAGAWFDVAVLDMHMPDMDGAQLAVALRALPPTAKMPMILLTSIAWRPGPDEQRLFHAVLTKPARGAALQATLARAVARATPSREAPRTVGGPSGSASGPLRVLLAEDNPVNLRVAQLMLGKLGHTVDSVSDGLEAVRAVARVPYDVVLMDVQMPVMDGLEATRRIRASHPPERQPHIIAMTASVLAEDEAACHAAGMDSHLPKPVRADDLRATLDAVVRLTPADAAGPAPREPVIGPAVAPDEAVSRETLLRQRFTDIAGPEPADDERTLLAALANSFVMTAPAALTALSDALHGGDAEAVQKQAHTLMGSAANVGAQALAAMCGSFEETARLGQLLGNTGLDPALARAAGELDLTCRALIALAAEFSTAERATSPPP